MTSFELFPKDKIVGVFRGFSEGGLEFHADLVLPYRNDFQSIPMHGQFLIVQLETPDEGVLGRITSLSSAGKLSSGVGEEFNIRAVREGRPVPEDLREQYLKYQIDIRVLGVLRNLGGELSFVASHRRLPHVGSPVAFLDDEVLREIIGHNVKGAPIGHFALGEYIYAQGSDQIEIEDWMQIKPPDALVKFPIENLVSRRTFIFARAGFGKSNLNKLLFSKLYETTPTVTKRKGRPVPVGTVLFDPDGEYFWPDDKGRPGLCDVPKLEDKLVVFTNRTAPSEFYQSFVAGGIKLDIRRLSPTDVISIAVSPERQSQQNIRKLRGLTQNNWTKLVDLIDEYGYQSPDVDIANLLGLDAAREEAQVIAARANMTHIVRMLHDKSSQLMDRLIAALAKGKLCIIDVSQMRGGPSLILSSLILRKIFDRNQLEFTAAEPNTIPTLAVVEEAQAVLNSNATGAEPYIAWVKEGRKYDLGAVLITQQPGSIPVEILSQGDNWFIFHLLSAADLNSIRNANAHFSKDILSALLNEPIPGQGVFWSSSSGKPFPVAVRILSFEQMYEVRDPNYNMPAADTFAHQLKEEFEATLGMEAKTSKANKEVDNETIEDESIDQLKRLQEIAIKAVQNALDNDSNINQWVYSDEGIAFGKLSEIIDKALPKNLQDRWKMAMSLVPEVYDTLFGPRGQKWETYRVDRGKRSVYARLLR
ncbi:MAG: hypothetical protein FOGNACKC_00509 [Anaerolineae bacterium]|nr:hypothetical protein [Anaerolineae bacterium]